MLVIIVCFFFFFFFNDTATTEIYTLSLHDALPILGKVPARSRSHSGASSARTWPVGRAAMAQAAAASSGENELSVTGGPCSAKTRRSSSAVMVPLATSAQVLTTSAASPGGSPPSTAPSPPQLRSPSAQRR